MGLSASQGRLLLLTAKQSDLEFRAQQISQKRLVLAQQLEEISKDYEDATSNRVMSIQLYNNEKDVDGNAIKTSCNLSYKNLISGTVNNSAAAKSAGLTYSKQEKYSNNIYRLVDASGATVVSSLDEILTTYKDETTKVTNNYVNATLKNGVYTSTKSTQTSTDGKADEESKQIQSSSKYVVVTKAGDNEAETDLQKAVSGLTEEEKKNCEVDETHGYIRIDGTTYKISDGSKVSSSTTFTGSGKADIVRSIDKVPQSSTTVTDKSGKEYTIGDGIELVPGGDGIYTLTIQGQISKRFIVDEALQGGSNSASDPNYLQDCLRNGKYIIEQYHTSVDTDTPTWDKVSWDATSNISDRYFTEDDAAAKAKYDRKQTEIQNADKKLELELDNVESQRNAVKTEIESVEKVINDNIDKSFKTFA